MLATAELVPVTDYRAAWNVLHGTELRHHDDRITPEQARQANRDYDIELELGDHGFPAYLPPDHPDAPPNETAYQAAADVIAGMEEGDVLFLEAPGSPAEELNRYSRVGTMRRFVRRSMGVTDAGPSPEERRAALEERREKREISAWDYALELASLKGIRVLNADIDAFELQSFEALTNGKGLGGIAPGASEDPADRRLWDDINAYRNRKFRNVVKDYAIEHSNPRPNADPGARKPKLVVLVGDGHGPDLRREFSESGLQVQSHNMKREFSPAQRQALERLFGALIVYALGGESDAQ